MIGRLAALLVCLAAPVAACEVPNSLVTLRAELLALTNIEREAAGAAPLRRDLRLEAAAQTQACRVAERQSLSHRGSWFAGLGRRLRREDYPYAMAAENLADGHLGATTVTQGWMESPAHRANLLDRRATEAGFGAAMGQNGRLHWSMILAAPQED
ncbi:CAP domain-containing protein [Pararhodobacter oceanensis]|uniref:CAP domain-containing protein n=1 Tax=Pararhodobacter oceanensis TaxID=2172121 RepID=A0A2T8HWU0_9RHOB|nr:CAP domain-containing protein [Pararhodobacter oceanensis]PVH29868.1 CAP domain-containing protein [Pararhodobacter oceanensis]